MSNTVKKQIVDDERKKNLKVAWDTSKVKGIEDAINTSAGIPIKLRQAYCILKRAYSCRFNKEYTEYNKQIKKLYNKYTGKRCFIIGMGPSLNSTDFSLIKDELMMAVNGFFTGIEKFNVYPQYWCVADIVVFDRLYEHLLRLDTTLFLTDEAGQLFLKRKPYFMKYAKKEPIVIKPYGYIGTWDKFSKNMTKGAYGGMVIFSCLQMAYYMGFKEIYLLGCDCSHSKGIHFDRLDDHSDDDTEGWSKTFELYEMCKNVFEENGRKIYNATVGGKLEVFERKKLEELT